MLNKFIDNFETYVCRTLLVAFVLLLFFQIIGREVFHVGFSWTEELSTYMFVWFVYLGASYAAKMGAHNRVTFQFNLIPDKAAKIVESFADFIWICFNIYFVYLSYDFVFNRMNTFWKSQTLGVQMKYFYMILPFAFLLMTIRIIQVNYKKWVKGEEIIDPETMELEETLKKGAIKEDV